MKQWGVWEVVPLATCWAATGKNPLGGKWVDVNKGDAEAPLVRSRYVAMEFAHQKDDNFFAATPPLEAIRLLLSRAATGRTHGRGGRKILIIDARKAHLHALADRDIFVQLPPEVAQSGMCGHLRRCLYGTRDAPARWEAYLAEQLTLMGFARGAASPCCYKHASHDIQCVVHGDDFAFVGGDADLTWAERKMGEHFLIKVIGRLGGARARARNCDY